MANVDSTIKTETKNLALVVLVLSILLEGVYLIIGKWNYTVLLGNILGGSAGLLNFFLMGLGIQSALGKTQKDAKTTVSFSHTYRTIFLLAIMVIGVFVPIFDVWATIISVFFTSFGIYIRTALLKKNGQWQPVQNEEADGGEA